MSKFSINDKVSFINEKQDGIIKAILPGEIYKVEIDDGFEIDVPEKELVLIYIKSKNEPVAEKLTEKPQKPIPEFIKNIPALSSGIWVLTCPAESGMTLTGPIDYYLINNSEYTILFSISVKTAKKLKGIFSAKALPAQEIFIANFKRPDIIDFEAWQIQLLFHKESEFELQNTITREIPISLPDLSSDNSSLKMPYALCKYDFIAGMNSVELDNIDDLFSQYSAKDVENAMRNNTGKKSKSDGLLPKAKASQYEVDLHIEELIESFNGLSNAEIITIQLNHFRKKLDEALYHKAYKIIFIHGVGNGKLKSAIRSELALHNLKYTDGATERYGGGATEVIL